MSTVASFGRREPIRDDRASPTMQKVWEKRRRKEDKKNPVVCPHSFLIHKMHVLDFCGVYRYTPIVNPKKCGRVSALPIVVPALQLPWEERDAQILESRRLAAEERMVRNAFNVIWTAMWSCCFGGMIQKFIYKAINLGDCSALSVQVLHVSFEALVGTWRLSLLCGLGEPADPRLWIDPIEVQGVDSCASWSFWLTFSFSWHDNADNAGRLDPDLLDFCFFSEWFRSAGSCKVGSWIYDHLFANNLVVVIPYMNHVVILDYKDLDHRDCEIVILSQVASSRYFFLDAPTVWWWASLNLSDDPISVGWSVQFKEHPISWDRNLPTLSGGEHKSNSWVHHPIFWDHRFFFPVLSSKIIILLFPNPLSKFFMFFSMRTIQVFGFSHGKKSCRPWVSVRSFISSGWQRPWSARLHKMLRSGDFDGDSFYGY